MGTVGLKQITITPLNRINTEHGDVLHAIKSSDTSFHKFGEAYFSFVNFNQIKGWKRHRLMTLNLVVPIGRVRFVFVEGDLDSHSDSIVMEIGEDSYSRITVPPGIWLGFKGMSESQNLILNIASEQHDPKEVDRKPLSEFSFD